MPPRKPKRSADADRHLTTEQLADRLGISPRTVEDWRLDGKGPKYLPVGVSATKQTVRYRLADVEAWEESRLVTPGAPKALQPQPA